MAVEHICDTALTTQDQWLDDDPAGSMELLISGVSLPLAPGNVVASIRCDRQLPNHERNDLTGGIGFFADVARCGRYLAHPDDAERRRRLAGLVMPHRFPLVLATAESRTLAAIEVEQRLLFENETPVASDVIGYLHALPVPVSSDAKTKLGVWIDLSVGGHHSTDFQRMTLCRALAERDGGTPDAACMACCLRLVCSDGVPNKDLSRAEKLLGSLGAPIFKTP